MPLWLFFFPKTVETWLTVDGSFMLISAIVVSYRHNRWDIVMYLPAYILLRFVDSYLFLLGFHKAFFGTETGKLSWQSSTRYQLN